MCNLTRRVNDEFSTVWKTRFYIVAIQKLHQLYLNLEAMVAKMAKDHEFVFVFFIQRFVLASTTLLILSARESSFRL